MAAKEIKETLPFFAAATDRELTELAGGEFAPSKAEDETARALHLPESETSLLVSHSWIVSNAPQIQRLDVCRFEVSEDGEHATRKLDACIRPTEEELAADDFDDEEWEDNLENWAYAFVKYDMPPADESAADRQRRTDRHRRREEASIRALDGEAAVTFRERKGALASLKRARDEEASRDEYGL